MYPLYPPVPPPIHIIGIKSPCNIRMVIKRTNANNDKLTRRSLQEEFALTPVRCNRSFSLLKHRNIQDVLKYESHDGRQVTQADKQMIR